MNLKQGNIFFSKGGRKSISWWAIFLITYLFVWHSLQMVVMKSPLLYYVRSLLIQHRKMSLRTKECIKNLDNMTIIGMIMIILRFWYSNSQCSFKTIGRQGNGIWTQLTLHYLLCPSHVSLFPHNTAMSGLTFSNKEFPLTVSVSFQIKGHFVPCQSVVY